MKKEISFTRIFNAPVEKGWKCFTDPQLVMQWWGPDKFTCPSAKIDFRVGSDTIVCMRAPKEFGGLETYNKWTYTNIIPLESIEYLQNLSDEDGNEIDPASVNLPPDFPKNTETIINFKKLGDHKTEITFTEVADFGQIFEFAKLGLNQILDKMKGFQVILE